MDHTVTHDNMDLDRFVVAGSWHKVDKVAVFVSKL